LSLDFTPDAKFPAGAGFLAPTFREVNRDYSNPKIRVWINSS
jgi:hypothetical protein